MACLRLVAFVVSAALPPVAIVVAISRYRLFDIDAILSRTFVFGALTAILAGVYTASIRLFNSLFTALTGEASDAALVITTLVIAASFTPIRRRLEAVVERRFTASQIPALGTDQATAEPPGPEPWVAWSLVVDAATLDLVVGAVLADPAFQDALAAQVRAAAAPPLGAPRSGAEP
jgi:hypothetical protein